MFDLFEVLETCLWRHDLIEVNSGRLYFNKRPVESVILINFSHHFSSRKSDRDFQGIYVHSFSIHVQHRWFIKLISDCSGSDTFGKPKDCVKTLIFITLLYMDEEVCFAVRVNVMEAVFLPFLTLMSLNLIYGTFSVSFSL